MQLLYPRTAQNRLTSPPILKNVPILTVGLTRTATP